MEANLQMYSSAWYELKGKMLEKNPDATTKGITSEFPLVPLDAPTPMEATALDGSVPVGAEEASAIETEAEVGGEKAEGEEAEVEETVDVVGD